MFGIQKLSDNGGHHPVLLFFLRKTRYFLHFL